MTFEQWMKKVDEQLFILTCRTILSNEELPDWDYRNDYDTGCSPQQSAKNAYNYTRNLFGF